MIVIFYIFETGGWEPQSVERYEAEYIFIIIIII